MREGSGLVEFSKRFGDRYFDVGIAEPHALTFASGLASEGFRPVVAIYSTFLQRAYDQVIHDVCLQNLPILFAIDRGGLVGADGPTHHGVFDLSYLRAIPNLAVMTPANGPELQAMLDFGAELPGPAAVRYPRATATEKPGSNSPTTIQLGKGEICRSGKGVAILVFGTLLETALQVAEDIDATVANMRFVKPLDEELAQTIARSHELIVTIEENVVAGGAGSAVSECLLGAGFATARLSLGIPDRFIEHAERLEQLKDCGLDAAGIRAAILRIAPRAVASRAESA